MVESLLRLIGLDRGVRDFSTFNRRPKTLEVDIPFAAHKGRAAIAFKRERM